MLLHFPFTLYITRTCLTLFLAGGQNYVNCVEGQILPPPPSKDLDNYWTDFEAKKSFDVPWPELSGYLNKVGFRPIKVWGGGQKSWIFGYFWMTIVFMFFNRFRWEKLFWASKVQVFTSGDGFLKTENQGRTQVDPRRAGAPIVPRRVEGGGLRPPSNSAPERRRDMRKAALERSSKPSRNYCGHFSPGSKLWPPGVKICKVFEFFSRMANITSENLHYLGNYDR